MKKILFLICILQFGAGAFDSKYDGLAKEIVRDLNYIFQERSWTGGSTYAKETKIKYKFKKISDHEIEITKSTDGLCSDEPFIIDLKDEYSVELEADDRCDPALKISHGLDIIYLYVKDRCGNFGGFNLYKRAQDATVLLKEHFHAAYQDSK